MPDLKPGARVKYVEIELLRSREGKVELWLNGCQIFADT